MRTATSLFLLSCWTLQPIHASLPEPAPPLKLLLDDTGPPLSIAQGSYGTALLFQEAWGPGATQVAGCVLTMIRKGGFIDCELPAEEGQALRPRRGACLPDPYSKQIICLGEKGTCLVAGRRLRDFRFVPEENAAADFPDLVPLVGQAGKIGKNNYQLSFAWVNQAKNRLLLLSRRPGGGNELLYYLAKGKKPCAFVFSDKPLRDLQDAEYLSARSLFLQDGSCVFLCKDGERLVVFPATPEDGYIIDLPGQCKGMSRQGDQQIRLLIQSEGTGPIAKIFSFHGREAWKDVFSDFFNTYIAHSLNFIKFKASVGEGSGMAALPPAVPLATHLGKGYWVYLIDKKLILWSEKEGPAPAPLLSDIDVHGDGLRPYHSSCQVADGGHGGHRRILYCLSADRKKRAIGAIDMPPATLYQEAKKLKKAAGCFPVHGPDGTAGFYVAKTAEAGTFFSYVSDSSLFSLEKGSEASIPLTYQPEHISQVACWFCPGQDIYQLYLAVAIAGGRRCCLYGVQTDCAELPFEQIKWQGRPSCLWEADCDYSFMQWIVDEKTKTPVLVYLTHGVMSPLRTVSGFPGLCKHREEKGLGDFIHLAEGNLAARTSNNTIDIYRFAAKDGELTADLLFRVSPGSCEYVEIRALISMQETGTERVLIFFQRYFYIEKDEVRAWMSGVGEVAAPQTCLLPPGFSFTTYCIRPGAVSGRKRHDCGNTAARPCVIVKDRKGDLSLLHLIPGYLLVTGYLRRLGLSEEYLYQDVMGLLVRSLGGALLSFQEQTSWRSALITWSSHFDFSGSVTCERNQAVVGRDVKCSSRSLVPLQE